MTATFRLPHAHFWMGVGFALVFGAAMAGGVAIALFDPKVTAPAALICLFGGVFGSMTLLALYMIAAQCIERVDVNGDLVAVRSVFQNRRFALSEIESVKWYVLYSPGRVTIDARGERTRIDLAGYSLADRLRLMQLFHSAVPEEKQIGWPRYCQLFAMQTYNRLTAQALEQPRTPEADEMLLTRRHYDAAFAVILPLSAVVAKIGWGMSGIRQFFALPALVVVGWLFLRFQAPQKGRVIRRPPMGTTIALSIWLLVGLPLSVAALSFTDITENIRLAIVLLAWGPLLAFMLYRVAKDARVVNERKSHGEAQAVELWNRDERGVLKSLMTSP